MKKYSIVLLMLVLMMSAMIVGCSKDKKPGNQETTPTISTGDNNQVTPTEAPGPVGDDSWDEISCKDIAGLIGPGWNVGNQLEASSNGIPRETAWQATPITKELIHLVKESGFNFVRVPVSYLGKMDKDTYEIDAKWLDRIKQVVDYCYDEGMFVMINVHGDGYKSVTGGWLLPGEADQDAILKRYEALWSQVAERFKDYDEHLIFESMNEVGSEYDCSPEIYKNLNAYNQLFLNTVRKSGGNNAKRYVLVPGYNTNIDLTCDNSGFKLPEDIYLDESIPKDEKRVMVSVHYYSPWSFCGGETPDASQWGVDANPSKGANWGEEAYMEQQFKTLYDCFVSQGNPVIIGEYGAIDKSFVDEESEYYRGYFCNMVSRLGIKYGLIPVYWDNGYNGNYGFALFDRKEISVTHQPIIDAIMAAYEKDSETEGKFTVEEDSFELTAGGASKQIILSDLAGQASFYSTDYSVATVDKVGNVYPQLVGECQIVIKDETGVKKVTVKVAESTVTNAKLYLLETKGWQTYASSEAISLEKPGSYTLTVKASDASMDRIGSLYIKDVALQDGIIKKSLLKNAAVVVTSVKINDQEMTLTENATGNNLVNNNGDLDFTILNMWAPNTEVVKEGVKSDNGYSIEGLELKGDNEITVKFTVMNVNY